MREQGPGIQSSEVGWELAAQPTELLFLPPAFLPPRPPAKGMVHTVAPSPRSACAAHPPINRSAASPAHSCSVAQAFIIAASEGKFIPISVLSSLCHMHKHAFARSMPFPFQEGGWRKASWAECSPPCSLSVHIYRALTLCWELSGARLGISGAETVNTSS